MSFFKQAAPQDNSFPVRKTEAEWRQSLSPEAFRVLREHGTERPGTSPLNNEKRPGRFLCAGCGHALFDSATKYESGSGWPSLHPLMGPSAAKLINHFSWCGPKSTARLAADIWDMFSLTALNQPDCAIA